MITRKAFPIIAAVLAIAIAVGLIFILTNLDHLVKAAIEKYGTRAVKTQVSVSSVAVRLSSGEATIAGLDVANPRGFANPQVFALGAISVRLDPGSVTHTPVVIQDIRVSRPRVFYEMNAAGVSNLDVLTRNVQGTTQPGGKQSAKKKNEPLFAVRKLVIENGQVEARIAALGDKPILLDLPRLELQNIGGSRGAPPGEIAKTVATALAEQTAKAVARSQGERYLKKGAEGLLKRYLEQ